MSSILPPKNLREGGTARAGWEAVAPWRLALPGSRLRDEAPEGSPSARDPSSPVPTLLGAVGEGREVGLVRGPLPRKLRQRGGRLARAGPPLLLRGHQRHRLVRVHVVEHAVGGHHEHITLVRFQGEALRVGGRGGGWGGRRVGQGRRARRVWRDAAASRACRAPPSTHTPSLGARTSSALLQTKPVASNPDTRAESPAPHLRSAGEV